jgi:Bacterial Ig-like domain
MKDALRVGTYPQPGARHAHRDSVVKVFFSAPVEGVDAGSFFLTDAQGARVPAWVDPIGDAVFGLFADAILLQAGASYTAHLRPGICDAAGNCTGAATDWTFTVAADDDTSEGDSSILPGFAVGR